MKLVTQTLTFSLATVVVGAALAALALRPTVHAQEIVRLQTVVVTGKRAHVEQLPRVVVQGHSVHGTQLA